MRRRDFLKGLGLAVLAAPAAGLARDATEQKPNIILIMADDVSAKEFACYGSKEIKTPVLDELGRTGVRFKTCWCTPICSPTRAEIMTGRYGFRTGWFHNAWKPGRKDPGGVLAESHKVFGQLLKQAGYATAICGKWQLRGTPEQHGFDEACMWEKYEGFDGPVETDADGVLPGRAARYWHPSIVRNGKPVPTTDSDYGPDIFVDFLLDFVQRNRKGPFLAYYPMCLVHGSWDFQAKRRGHLPTPKVDADGKKVPGKVAGSLKGDVEYLDHLVGRIVKRVRELGLREKTVILFTSDNGTPLYGKSRVDQERGPRVPMIVNAPGIVKARGAVDALIDFSDILPTLCDLGGAKPPKDYAIDGHSFAPILRGDDRNQREWIFSYYAGYRMLRDKRWLLDGKGRFWDCGSRRDEKGYKDVTDSKDPQVQAARKRFAKILERLPAPTQAQRKYSKQSTYLKNTRKRAKSDRAKPVR